MPLTTDQAYTLLESAHERKRLGHAFLLTGGEGTGKRELAARLITLLTSDQKESGEVDMFGEAVPSVQKAYEDGDLDEMEGEFIRFLRPLSKSRTIKVDEVREFEDSFYMSAPEGQWKIGVIYDVDRMNENAANAFLKTLEEPPKNCLLLLLTTAPDRLLTTILSRCVKIPLYNPDTSSLSPAEERIQQLLREGLTGQERGLISALSLKSEFETYLKEKKKEIEKKHKQAFKQESEPLKQAGNREYLKEKEEESKAAESAEYIALRTDSLNALVSWFGDVLRWKVGHVPQRFKRDAELFHQFSQGLPIESLLLRLEALEELRFLLNETNVSEALALETSFMKVFG